MLQKSEGSIAKEKNFSKAARRFGVSQPAISLQMRNLQNRYGAKIFCRWGRTIELSEFGQELVTKARLDASRIGHIGDIHPRDMEHLVEAIETAMYWRK